jgi:hypothetical protein
LILCVKTFDIFVFYQQKFNSSTSNEIFPANPTNYQATSLPLLQIATSKIPHEAKLAIQHFFHVILMLIYRFINKFLPLQLCLSTLPWLNYPRNSSTSTHARSLSCLHKPNIPPRRAINIQWFPSSQISSGLLRAMRVAKGKV